jgi:hypothetical protein
MPCPYGRGGIFQMKYDSMCAACLRECKQPATAKLVSCPHFKQASRSLDMFDMSGEVRKDLAKRNKSGAKKQRRDT